MRMRRRTLRAAVLLLMLLVLAAGCATDESDEGTSSGQASSSENGSGGQSTLSEEKNTENTTEKTEKSSSELVNPTTSESIEADIQKDSEADTETTILYSSVYGLNLRGSPSLEGHILRQAEKGEAFTFIQEEGGEWTMIEDGEGQFCYAASRYLSKYDPLAGENFVWKLTDLTVVDTREQKYTYEEMAADLEELAESYPEHMRLSSIGTTKDGRELYLALLGNRKAESSIVVQAAIHSREYMTTLLTMKQLEYYLYYYDTGYYKGIPYSEIFESTSIYLIPMLNPDGVAISQSGLSGIRSEEIQADIKEWYERDKKDGQTTENFDGYLERFKANANGVDLNRNFDMGWNEFVGSGRQGADRYKGSAAGSEPESAALIELTEDVLPKAALSYHATGSILYWDYGQTGEFRTECETITRIISGLTGYPLIMKDSDEGGVDAAGYSDWAAGVKEIPAVTIEIGTGRAPLDIEEFASIWKKNREVIAAVAAYFLED